MLLLHARVPQCSAQMKMKYMYYDSISFLICLICLLIEVRRRTTDLILTKVSRQWRTNNPGSAGIPEC